MQCEVLRFFWNGLVATVKAATVAMVTRPRRRRGSRPRTPGPQRAGPLAGRRRRSSSSEPSLSCFSSCSAGLALPKYGVDLSAFWLLVLALVAYNGAVLGEIFRAGILSLDRGQTEAAYAIGLTYWQTMRIVIIPQAARRMIPSIVSQLVTLLKDTSLGFVISYEELLRRSRSTGEFFHNPLQATVFVGLIYVVVNFTLGRIARRLEVRQRRRYNAGAVQVTGAEDLTVVGAQGEADLGR